jgi:hypothetical protein
MIAAALLLLIAIPGVSLGSLLFRRRLPEIAWVSLAGATGLLWSLVGTLVLTLLHIPLSALTLVLLGMTPLLLLLIIPSWGRTAKTTLRTVTWSARNVVLWLSTIIFLSLPFLTVHQGLPTGDVQKALFWAQEVSEHHRTPLYREATKLNRDPTDFVTPGLHTLTAAVGILSQDALRGSAWFSFMASIILAGLAAALAAYGTHHAAAPILAFLFAALNLRFLRYAFSPGYHYQNLLGEILLLLALVALVGILERTAAAHAEKPYPLFLLGGASVLATALVHQFTAFLSVFLFGGVLLAALLKKRNDLRLWWRRDALRVLFLALGIGTLLALSPLPKKLPDVFTTTPHLTSVLIPPAAIPALLGKSLVLFGIAGMVVSRYSFTLVLLAVWTVLILLLSQGPRFFLDIPSARTLFYATTPLAVFTALLITRGHEVLHQTFPRFGGVLALLTLTLALAPLGQTAAAQLGEVSHASRVNASLTEETIQLLEFLRSQPVAPGEDGLLIDDWNRRRLTWTILSPYRMLTRVGGDLRVIADESTQSALRKTLYDAHLDFEKIFMIGNSPIILPLLQKHGIALIGTANGLTDDVFSSNPLFREVFRTNDGTLFRRQDDASPTTKDPFEPFLLSPTTLVNDVGDHEDILPHTAISIASTRISKPEVREGRTVRVMESEESVLRVNVETYVKPLWDEDGDKRIQHPLRLLLRAEARSAQATISALGVRLGTVRASPGGGFTDTVINIPRGTLMTDDEGFVALTVAGARGPLTLDLVALGISP